MITIRNLTGQTFAQEKLIREAMDLRNRVVEMQRFFEFIAKRKMVQTQGDNAITIMAFARTNADFDINVYHPFWRWSSAIGYTDEGDTAPCIHVNGYKLGTLNDLASFFCHEPMHAEVMGGYTHDFRASEQRPYSVPYSMNAGFDACVEAVK